MDTVVKSHIVSQDDQAHSIYAEYEIVDQNGQVVGEKTRSEAQSVPRSRDQPFSKPCMLKTNPLGCENGSSALYTLVYARVYPGFTVGGCAKGTL